MSWAGNYVEKRTRKNMFFRQIDEIIDWKSISKEIDKVCKKGQSLDGRLPFREIVLFKMMLLKAWYNLSDLQVEVMVNKNLSVMRLCILEMRRFYKISSKRLFYKNTMMYYHRIFISYH